MTGFDPLSRAEAFYLKPKQGCLDFTRVNDVLKKHTVQLAPDTEISNYHKFLGETDAIRTAIKELEPLYAEIEWLCYLVTEEHRGRCLYNATPGAWCVWLDWPNDTKIDWPIMVKDNEVEQILSGTSCSGAVTG